MRHPKPAVRAALKELTADGSWVLRKGGHWGVLTCAYSCKCQISVNGSPQNEDDHAKYLRRKARRCRKAT
jgi:hypothetical protein